MQDKISIVTISFCCRDIIEETIKSVITQSYKNIEYIIIDGGSGDGTLDTINRYRANINVLISEPDAGIYDAMNKGIKAATGDWIIFMNAGDRFYSKDAVASFVNHYDGHSDIVYGNAVYKCDYCSFIPNFPPDFKMESCMPMCHQSTFVKLDYHKKHLFDTSFKSSGDYNFLYNAFFKDKLKFQAIPSIISIYDASGGMSKDHHVLSLHENLRIWNKQNDIRFRFVQELYLLKFRIKQMIKNMFCSDRKKKELEIRRLQKLGRVIN